METVIVIDEHQDAISGANEIIDLDKECNDDDVIEVVDVEGNYRHLSDMDKQQSIFEEFLQKCFTVDTSPGMVRVINRTLVPLYKSKSCRFNSTADAESFENALRRALFNVERDPVHRYSHIKGLCETLKYLKKKVPLVNVKKKGASKKKFKGKKNKNHGKKPRIDTNIINLDDEEEEYEVPVVNLDEVINSDATDEKENTGDNIVATNSVAEKHFIEINLTPVPYNVVDKIQSNLPNYVETVSSSTENDTNGGTTSEVNQNSNKNCFLTNDNLLEARTSQVLNRSQFGCESVSINGTSTLHPNNITAVVPTNNDQYMEDYIQRIEIEIRVCKKMIDSFNVLEVTEDSALSPYLQCEYFQKKIVELYDKLCRLKGLPSVKRREVRLRAIDSRPELPMKKLENLINSNIGHDGLPHFPDFEEVTNCVKEANFEGNLGWDSKQILNEARVLFVHCGRALQRKRQRREWRDLMSLVKDETLEDPADKDPVLQARLKQNRYIAKSKEMDVLEKYTSMEYSQITSYNRTSSQNNVVNYTNERDEQVITNKDNIETQIKIVSVASCKEPVKRVPLITHISIDHTNINNVDVVCDSQQSNQTEMHNDSTNNQIQNPVDTSQNINEDLTNKSFNNELETSNAELDVAVNTNEDERNEILSVLNSSKCSNIHVVSIETFDDFDTNNNDFISTENTLDDSIRIATKETESKEKETEDLVTSDNDKSLECQNNTNLKNKENQNIETEDTGFRVKSEYDTIKALNELGENYTTTILNVIDPFLIIEISSDSSSDDEDADNNSTNRKSTGNS